MRSNELVGVLTLYGAHRYNVPGEKDMTMNTPAYEVVWPRGRRTVEVAHLAKRLDTLEGKTICALWDWVFRGDEVFPLVEKELKKRFPGLRFVGYEVFGSIHGDNEAQVLAALPDKLKEYKCDGVISGLGC
jgi:hypothetical protein